MAQHGHHLLRLTLLDQSVVDDNVLLPGQAIEVRIAMRAPLAPINNIKLLEREFQPFSQPLHPSLQRSLLQRRQLVEQRQDEDRVDRDREDLNANPEQPEVIEEPVPGLLHDLEEDTENGCPQRDHQSLALQHVGDPQSECLLVEAELLLQDKGAVVRGREREEGGDEVEGEEEDERVRLLTGELVGGISCQPDPRHGPELRQQVHVDDCEILDLAVEAGDETELCFRASICLVWVVSGSLSRIVLLGGC